MYEDRQLAMRGQLRFGPADKADFYGIRAPLGRPGRAVCLARAINLACCQEVDHGPGTEHGKQGNCCYTERREGSLRLMKPPTATRDNCRRRGNIR